VKLELPSPPHLCRRSEESPIYRRSPKATPSTPQLGEDDSLEVLAWLALSIELRIKVYQGIKSSIIVLLQFAFNIIRRLSEMLLEPYLSQNEIRNVCRTPLCFYPHSNMPEALSYHGRITQVASSMTSIEACRSWKDGQPNLLTYCQHVCTC